VLDKSRRKGRKEPLENFEKSKNDLFTLDTKHTNHYPKVMDDLDYAMTASNVVVDVPPKLLLELAVGIDTSDELCSRYNITRAQYDAIVSNPGIQSRISRTAAELKKDGITVQMRGTHATEDLIGRIWQKARNPDTPLLQMIEAAKFLSKLGGVDEPAQVKQAQGSGFSITINLGDTQQNSATIDVTPTTKTVSADSGSTWQLGKNAELALSEDWEWDTSDD
jgi:hypothetical protein